MFSPDAFSDNTDGDTLTNNWRKLTASDVMTHNVLTVQQDWSVERLSRFLTDQSISGAPVVNESRCLTGVVTLTDIVRQNGSGLLDIAPRDDNFYLGLLDRKLSIEEQQAFHESADKNILVADIMTPAVYSVSPETLVGEIADAMIRGHIHRVLVTESGHVTGIVTVLDLLRVMTSP